MKVLTSKTFEENFLPEILGRSKIQVSKVSRKVEKIIRDVKEKGDLALLYYTKKFDCSNFTIEKLRVSEEEIKDAYKKLKYEELKALNKAAENIKVFHQNQIKNKKWCIKTCEGVKVGQIIRPLSSVGVYTPSGKATYPSSALMCTIPAKIAGVKRIVLCSPPNTDGKINPSVLVAADIGGANEIYKVGGAHAVAALAYGTETIFKVEKIVGPGNIYVTAAKLLVSMDVAVDLPAGPTELLVIADENADPEIVACDMIAQAEHDSKALTILLTTSQKLAYAVEKEIKRQLIKLPKFNPARKSIRTNCFIVIVESLESAISYANHIGPEHLEILTEKPECIIENLTNAGAVFLGQYSAVAFGDYSAGINHVLPTAGFARIFSGLSVWSFLKTINFLECTAEGYKKLKDATVTLAEMEGFVGHANSVLRREIRV